MGRISETALMSTRPRSAKPLPHFDAVGLTRGPDSWVRAATAGILALRSLRAASGQGVPTTVHAQGPTTVYDQPPRLLWSLRPDCLVVRRTQQALQKQTHRPRQLVPQAITLCRVRIAAARPPHCDARPGKMRASRRDPHVSDWPWFGGKTSCKRCSRLALQVRAHPMAETLGH